jgi:hypothetical protein
MKLSEFEKRHGKINDRFKSHFWNGKTAQKYGLSLPYTPDTDLPAHIWHIIKNMSDSVSTYSNMSEHVQNIFNYMASEKRKEVRDLFLNNMDGLYFSDYWGFFRASQNNPDGCTDRTKKDFIKALKCIKRGYKKYRHRNNLPSIDSFIRFWGGAPADRTTKKQALEQAAKKLQNGDKMPRKLKKQVKNQGFFNKLFGHSK